MKIKNVKFVKTKLLPLLLAGTIALPLASCNGNVDMKSVTFGDLMAISDVKDDTLLDEMIDNGKFMYDDEMSYLEAADKLLESIDISERLEKFDFSEISELKPLSEEELANLDNEDVDQLIENLSDKSDSYVDLEKKLDSYKKLYAIKNKADNFIMNDGEDISLRVMFGTVKAAVADDLGLSYEDISSITIPEYYYSGDGPEDYSIKVNDKAYRIPLSSEEIWNTVNYIYEVQHASLTDETRNETYRKAINYAKTTLAAGVDINDNNNKIKPDRNASEISKNYLH